jgi:hypothetical protein
MNRFKRAKIIALHDADDTVYPNLALMKLSAWHKKRGDKVCRYIPLLSENYNKGYSSKVFSFTPNMKFLYGNIEKGGHGYKLQMRRSFKKLPEAIEHIKPDYSLYNCDRSYGFLTRGCPNKCSWCIVPTVEGKIRPHADIEEFLDHNAVILMDNNILASDHGIQQIEKMARLGIKVDFNQGLDARLIDNKIAKRLSKLKWLSPVRLACDTQSQKKHIQRAITNLRWHNVTPRLYFVYLLVTDDIEDAIDRIRFLKGLDVYVFAQVYIPYDCKKVIQTNEQAKLLRWVNRPSIFRSCSWEEYNYKIRLKLLKQNKRGNLL